MTQTSKVGILIYMKKRYELRHDRLGSGYRYTDLVRAKKELAHCIPAGEWYIFDRQERERVA